MLQNQSADRETVKESYQAPELEVISFSYVGTSALSGNGDENEGDWDPLT